MIRLLTTTLRRSRCVSLSTSLTLETDYEHRMTSSWVVTHDRFCTGWEVYQEWHCTLRGPAGTEFEGGLYHFRILLPAEYPFRPPSIMMLTPNGRFELNTKVNDTLKIYGNALIHVLSLQICISFTNCAWSIILVVEGSRRLSHVDHEELWQPAWGVRTGEFMYVESVLH